MKRHSSQRSEFDEEMLKARGQYMKEFIRQAVQFSGQCLIKRC